MILFVFQTVSPKVFLKTELSFDFNRLNVLLLRTLSCDGHTVAQKVATATMTGAKIQATLGNYNNLYRVVQFLKTNSSAAIVARDLKQKSE